MACAAPVSIPHSTWIHFHQDQRHSTQNCLNRRHFSGSSVLYNNCLDCRFHPHAINDSVSPRTNYEDSDKADGFGIPLLKLLLKADQQPALQSSLDQTNESCPDFCRRFTCIARRPRFDNHCMFVTLRASNHFIYFNITIKTQPSNGDSMAPDGSCGKSRHSEVTVIHSRVQPSTQRIVLLWDVSGCSNIEIQVGFAP